MEVLWLHRIAEGIMVLAYLAVPGLLLCLALRGKSAPFRRIFVLLSLFILFSGLAYIAEIITVGPPLDGWKGSIKSLAALAALAAALSLMTVIPRAWGFPSYQSMNDELRRKADYLLKVNAELEKFGRAATGREERIIQLKREVNRLAQELGRTPPYPVIAGLEPASTAKNKAKEENPA